MTVAAGVQPEISHLPLRQPSCSCRIKTAAVESITGNSGQCAANHAGKRRWAVLKGMVF